jgi:hypothetical protein
MNESLSLRDATVQDIQLELIRRTRFNAMDAERVVASLVRHRDLWLAVILDRPGYADPDGPEPSIRSNLIKLRDLSENLWNVDTLFVMTPTREHARRLARIAEEGWGGDDVCVYEDPKRIAGILGVYPTEYGLLSVWWD